MDLTLQASRQCCSSQHWILLSPPDTSTTGHPFCFGSVLFIPSGSISLLLPSDILDSYWPGELIFHCHIFLPFCTVNGVLRERMVKWFANPFTRGPVLSVFSTTTHLSWVTLQGMAYSFIELDKALIHVIRLDSFLCFWFSLCLPSDLWRKKLPKLPNGSPGSGENWSLLWWVWPCSGNLIPIFC